MLTATRIVFTAIALLLAVLVGPVYAQRLAVVVGNGDYTGVQTLDNPVNDALQMGEKLESVGFEVLYLKNLMQADLGRQLEDFLAKADDPEMVLFFFSGHGVQINGVNYLLPVDAEFSAGQTIAEQGWALTSIVRRIERLQTNSLILIDACRDDPLPLHARDKYAIGKGLARIESGKDTKILFATLPDAVAYEGLGDTSFFTQALLDHIDTPGLSLDDVIRRVRNQVRTETYEQQIPFSLGNLSEAFYFQPAIQQRDGFTEADLENLVLNYPPEDRELVLARLVENLGVDMDDLAPRVDEVADRTSVDTILAGYRVNPNVVFPNPNLSGRDANPDFTELPDSRSVPDTSDGGEAEIVPVRLGRAMSAVPALRSRTPERLLPMRLDRTFLQGTVLDPDAIDAETQPSLPLPDVVLEAPLDGRDLDREVQVELARVGCYQDRIDGIFGRNSRFALTSYFLAKGVVFETLDRSMALLQQLRTEPKVVCTGQETQVVQARPRVAPQVVPVRIEATPSVIREDKAQEIESGRAPLGIRFR